MDDFLERVKQAAERFGDITKHYMDSKLEDIRSEWDKVKGDSNSTKEELARIDKMLDLMWQVEEVRSLTYSQYVCGAFVSCPVCADKAVKQAIGETLLTEGLTFSTDRAKALKVLMKAIAGMTVVIGTHKSPEFNTAEGDISRMVGHYGKCSN